MSAYRPVLLSPLSSGSSWSPLTNETCPSALFLILVFSGCQSKGKRQSSIHRHTFDKNGRWIFYPQALYWTFLWCHQLKVGVQQREQIKASGVIKAREKCLSTWKRYLITGRNKMTAIKLQKNNCLAFSLFLWHSFSIFNDTLVTSSSTKKS